MMEDNKHNWKKGTLSSKATIFTVIWPEKLFVSDCLSTYVDRISNGSVSSELTEPVNKHL